MIKTLAALNPNNLSSISGNYQLLSFDLHKCAMALTHAYTDKHTYIFRNIHVYTHMCNNNYRKRSHECEIEQGSSISDNLEGRQGYKVCCRTGKLAVQKVIQKQSSTSSTTLASGPKSSTSFLMLFLRGSGSQTSTVQGVH